MKLEFISGSGNTDLYACGAWRATVYMIPYEDGWKWKVWNVLAESRADHGTARNHEEALEIVHRLVRASVQGAPEHE